MRIQSNIAEHNLAVATYRLNRTYTIKRGILHTYKIREKEQHTSAKSERKRGPYPYLAS
jgi:hypothetical protein